MTNDEGISDLKTFAITVGSSLGDILLLSKVLLATILAALILIFVFLLRKKENKASAKQRRFSPEALRKKQCSTPCKSAHVDELADFQIVSARASFASVV